MKRMILGISMLLMLNQNGFALTDAEYDKKIENETNQTVKELLRCDKGALNHKYTADVSACIKATKLLKKNYPSQKKTIAITLLNTGLIYEHSGDKLNAYKYYIESAKLGLIHAQKNLDIMCKKSSWACKQ